MSYRFQFNESLADGVPRIVSEQVDRAVAELTGGDTDLPEAVHQVRKRCKKIRGMLRLIRGSFAASYRQENAWFRDLARRLSGARDTQAMLECLDKLRDAFQEELEVDAFATVRQALVERQAAVQEDGALPDRVADTAAELQDARLRVLGWHLDDTGFAAIESGLSRTYRRARKAMRAGYENPTAENFHEWRKRVKYHWYHLRLLRELWPAPLKGLAAEAKQLADLLGDDHDLAVLRETLLRDRDASGDAAEIDALVGLAKRRQDQLRAEAQTLGCRLFAERPRKFCRRVDSYWRAAEYDAVRVAGMTRDTGTGC
ncbi:MAG: CHAD domain-containing protein [Gammaproteobacteria bacterium]|jgi:CHAD domain-containing protein